MQSHDGDIGVDQGEYSTPPVQMAKGQQHSVPKGGPGDAKGPENVG